MPGRAHAGAGRKVKDVEARKKMIVNDSGNDAGILYHTLPRQKTKRSSQPHSLKHSVSNNVAHTKKH